MTMLYKVIKKIFYGNNALHNALRRARRHIQNIKSAIIINDGYGKMEKDFAGGGIP